MNILFRSYIILLFLLEIIISIPQVSAQSYGLKFNGFDVTLDNRTALDLSPDDYLTFEDEFEISFDYNITRLYPDSNRGLFGYIVRIINKDHKNVDLISSMTKLYQVDQGFKLNIVISNFDSIVHATSSESNFNHWIRLKIKFNLSKDQMIFYTPDTHYIQENIGFKKKDDFKIIFGASDFEQFKTTDVPSMSIRNIEISEKGKIKYKWFLDEKENHIATDQIKGEKASVKNPVWLGMANQTWQVKYNNEIKGPTLISSDPKEGKIFLLGSDELTIYSTKENKTKKIVYQNNPPILTREFKSFYNDLEHKIFCYVVDEKLPYKLDIESGFWENTVNNSRNSTRSSNLNYNRYFDSKTNSIYTFGGYGLFKYNNEINRLDFNETSLTVLPTNDSIFKPKYLFGLGTLNDTIYLLGGYGSKSGNQMINPQSYYDLIGYSIMNGTLFNKFEIPHIIDDMCVANSMWIDANNRDYYALIFENHKFSGHLQMIKGNLNASKIDLVGSSIPYQFTDNLSNAGLMYMTNQNKLYAYTKYMTDSITTQTRIYAINYPPNLSLSEPVEVKKSKDYSTSIIGILAALFLGLGYLLFRRKNKVLPNTDFKQHESELAKESSFKEDTAVFDKWNYQLIFFGGFQVIGKNSKDITNEFTPLLKELFLLIWLHTFKNNKGISTEKITEILWYDKSHKSARNNRAVNLLKLRKLLMQLGSFEVDKKTGYWKCVFNEEEIKSDYVDFLLLTSSKTILTKKKVNQLIEITQKGPFLRNVQYIWLDEFKSNVSDATIEKLIYFAKSCDIKKETDFIIHLADSLLIFDITNEEAMIMKCKAQYFEGRHGHAKATYELFFKEYAAMYGQEYEKTFVDILKDLE